jgi:hypothetical protein
MGIAQGGWAKGTNAHAALDRAPQGIGGACRQPENQWYQLVGVRAGHNTDYVQLVRSPTVRHSSHPCGGQVIQPWPPADPGRRKPPGPRTPNRPPVW